MRTLMMIILIRRRWALMMMMVEQRCRELQCADGSCSRMGGRAGREAAERTIAGVMTARCVAAMVAAAAASSPP